MDCKEQQVQQGIQGFQGTQGIQGIHVYKVSKEPLGHKSNRNTGHTGTGHYRTQGATEHKE